MYAPKVLKKHLELNLSEVKAHQGTVTSDALQSLKQILSDFLSPEVDFNSKQFKDMLKTKTDQNTNSQ